LCSIDRNKKKCYWVEDGKADNDLAQGAVEIDVAKVGLTQRYNLSEEGAIQPRRHGAGYRGKHGTNLDDQTETSGLGKTCRNPFAELRLGQ
jgi:hypothetical protein